MKKILLPLILAVGLISSSSAQLTGSLTNGLVSYYGFNGNYNDSVGGNNLTTRANVSLGTDQYGRPNSALSIDATDGFAQSQNPLGISGNQDRTISLWVKGYGSGNFISFGNSSQNGGATDFLWNGVSWGGMGQVDIWGQYADIAVNNLGSNFLNNWHQITYAYSGNISTTSLYIDGIIQSTVVGKLNQTDSLNTLNTQITIGYNNGWINDPGTLISDVGIWNRALSASEITQLYAIPEPSTYALFGIGAIGMLMVVRRKKAV